MKQATFHIKLTFCLLLLSLLIQSSWSQTIVVNDPADDESTYMPDRLIEEVLISGQCASATVVSTNLFGTLASPGRSWGYFKRQPGSPFPFEEGILLSTTSANQISDPSTPNLGVNAQPMVSGDADNVLRDIINEYNAANGIPLVTLFNANAIEFEFVPPSNTINFRYIMASEEYQGAFPCSFSDAFGFLLKRKNSTDDFVNIATVPNTDPPVPVAVTTVHAGFNCPPPNEVQNPTYYAGTDNDTNFEGRTVVLNATADVIPNETYIIRLVIADANDSDFDSAVFLEAGSFNLGLDLGDDFVSSSNNAVCGDSVELTANLDGFDYQWFFNDTLIPGAVDQNYTATAGGLGAGRYKCEISSTGGTCTGEDEIEVEFATPASINPAITDLLECDPDGDLTEVFDLTSKDP